jgi:hypothetical protein
MLATAARRFFGATEGTVLIPRIELYNTADCRAAGACGGHNCNWCIDQWDVNRVCRDRGGRSWSAFCEPTGGGGRNINDFIEICSSGVSNWRVVTHEFGHYLMCEADEYTDEQGIRCGHSIMGHQNIQSGNYCYRYPQSGAPVRDVHGKDREPGAPEPGQGPLWTNFSERGFTPVQVSTTPDTHLFENFDFRGWVGYVQ